MFYLKINNFEMYRKYFYRILITIVSFFASQSIVNANLTTSQIAKKYSSSVVTIIALDENEQPISLGSGFFINKNGDIATNHHVLKGSVKAIIKTVNGEKGEILYVKSYNMELDLLIGETSLSNVQPISYGDSDAITVGEDVVAIGNPAGLEGSISKGIISGIRKVKKFKYIQITAPISPGSSGGPVFNLAGKVIGIATSYLDLGQSLNFAMPVNYLKELKFKRTKISSLPEYSKTNSLSKDNLLLQLNDIHYNYINSYRKKDLYGLTFSLKNISSYTIKDIIIFFVYKNSNGEVISYSSEKLTKSILPHLALQFNHQHSVKFFNNGEVETRILDYEIDRSTNSSPVDLLF